MTSILSQQLRKVSLAIGGNPGAPTVDHASVLYSAREAAETDTQTIHSDALYGLEQLSRTQPAFYAYQKSLFNASTLSLDRGKLTPEELAAVNKSIASFLQLLSPHFLAPSCFKVLEYLIRKYRVHQHNVEDLIACGLPFHSTNQFVRLVQAAKVDDTIWEFLRPMQKLGGALPRASLVQRCLTDKALLSLVCDTAKTSGSSGHPNRLLLSLYAVLVCELLVAAPQVDEDMIRLLLPYLLHGVADAGEVSTDFRTATYMILVQLCTIATLASDFLEVLMQQIVKNAAETEQQQVFMVLCHLAATQPQLRKLPKTVAKAVAKSSDTAAILEQLQKKRVRVQPFLNLLVASLCRHFGSTPHCRLLEQLICQLELNGGARSIADAVLQHSGEKEAKLQQHLQQILRALDLRCPDDLDAAINAAMQSTDPVQKAEKAAEVASFVGSSLSNTARAPLEGAAATIAHAIDSPSDQLRIQAVKQLDSLIDTEGEAAFVRSALLRRLSDEEPSVLEAVLSCRSLRLIPAAELAEALSAFFKRARSVQAGHGLEKSARKSLRDVVKKGLKVLVDASTDEIGDRVAAELLNFVLAQPSTKRVSATAVKCAQKLDRPLLAGLGEAAEERHAIDEEAPSGKAEVLAGNLAAISGLAGSLATASEEAITAVAKLADLPGRQLLLLALNAACWKGFAGSAVAAQAALAIVQSDWAALDSGSEEHPAIDDSAIIGADGLPSPATLEALVAQPGSSQVPLLHNVLLGALRALPEVGVQEARQLFGALTARQPKEAFRQHLAALVNSLSGGSVGFLADLFGCSDSRTIAEEQVQALELFAQGVFPEAAEIIPSDLLPRLLAALSSSAAAVRAAAVEAFEHLPKGLAGEGLSAKHASELAKGIVEHGKYLKGDAGALPEVLGLLMNGAGASGKAKGKKSSAGRALSGAASQAVASFLLAALPRQTGEAGLIAARALIHCLKGVTSAAHLLAAVAPLAERLLQTPHEVDDEAAELLREIVGLFTAEAAQEGSSAGSAQFPAKLLASMIAPTADSTLPLVKNVRVAAAGQITPQLFAALGVADQSVLITALLEAASRDPVNDIRQAAQRAMEPLPLDAALLVPFLLSVGMAPPTPPASKRTKKARTTTTAVAQPPPLASLTGVKPKVLLTGVLELLQWKSDVQSSSQLTQPLSATIRFLLAQLQKSAADGSSMDQEDDSEAAWATSADYLIQLALNALSQTATGAASAPDAEDIDLAAVVECTGAQCSEATRNAALHLLGNLTSLRPEKAVGVILQVVAAVGTGAEKAGNRQSQQIAAATLQAVAAAWLAAGRGFPELAETALSSTKTVAALRALPLLSALISAVPQVEGLQTILLMLLEGAAARTGSASAIDQQRDERPPEVALELAALLCHQVPFAGRVAAFSALLPAALEKSSNRPDEPLPQLATALVATELRQPGKSAAGLADQHLQALMQFGLHQLQLLGSQGTGNLSKQQRAAIAGVTRLLEALEAAMPPASFTSALLALLKSPHDSVRRRALRLFQASAAKAAEPEAVDAAMLFCGKVADLLAQGVSPATRQAALVALSTLAAAHGKERPKELVAVLPVVLAQVADAAWALQSSALATISAIVAAVGRGVLPVLPRLVPAVLSAADAATSELCGPEQPAPDIADMELDGTEAQKSDDDMELLPQSANGSSLKMRAGERQQLEAQAALAAVRSLVDQLGQFLNPHLASILALLLRRGMVQDNSLPGHRPDLIVEVASAIRERVPAVIPPRLLLPALVAHLDSALHEGSASTKELLRMADIAVSAMTPPTAAANADAILAFLLQVLDVRRQQPEAIADIPAIEAAAVQLLTQLTLKLSEARFKPMFLRLLDWAATPPLTGERGPERQIVLFKVVSALAEQLRGVFVPYYKHLLDLSVAHLGGALEKGTPGKKKKQKLATGSEYGGPDAGLLRLQVVKALHRCFLYDRQGFLDEAVFTRLLPPLVAQLAGELPQSLAEREVPADELPEAQKAAEGLDVMGQAAVDALVQMAITAGSDAMWKPLHHQVLMATRSESHVERRRALEVVKKLVDRLGEEYVMLLPEAMPFLAEVLEDPELHIQNETRALLRSLEELTGESLEEYLKS